MALPDVLDADQVLVNGGALSNVRFRISGGVQVRLISIFAGKIVTGDYTRDSEQLASTHTWSTWRGGMLVKRMDPTSQADRFYRSDGLWTHIPEQLTPPLRFYTGYTDQPVNTAARVAVVMNDLLYMTFNTKTRIWTEVNQNWVTPGGYVDATHDLTNNATHAKVLRLGSTNWLVICDGLKHQKYDGATWTLVTGDDSSVPKAAYLEEWDGRLWALTATQNKLWVTSDLSTWTAKATLPDYVGEVQRLIVTYSADGDAILHAVTKSALWLYDSTNDKWYRTAMHWPRHRRGGLGVANWQGSLYVSVGSAMYAYDGRTVRSLGLDREDEMPTGQEGYINTLMDGFRVLLAGTTAKDLNNYNLVMAWDGVGWHVIQRAIPSGTESIPLYYGAHDNKLRLWARHGDVGTFTYYLDYPEGSQNPRNNSSFQFEPGTWDFFTPWFDANLPETTKLALLTVAEWENASPSANLWSLRYAIDTNETWTFTGMTALVTSSGVGEVSTVFGSSGEGLTFRRIRFCLRLQPQFNAWPPLTLRYLKLRYLKLLDPLYGYSFTVVGPKDEGGDTVAQQFAHLKTLIDTDTLVEFKFLKDGQEIVTKRVKGTAFQASRYPGDDGRFRASVSVAEIA